MKPHWVTQHRSTWSEPPRKVPCNTATDAPLLGNGDLGVCIGGPPEDQGYWIAKNDFWKMRSRHDSTGVRMFGTLRVSVPCLQGASYHVEQELHSAVTLSRFSTGSATLHVRSWVAATVCHP